MSIIKKTPYVETMIKAYNTTTLNNLLTQLNSASANIVEATFGNLPNDLVATCRFRLEDNLIVNAILVREEDKPTHLIKYDTSKQDLVIYKLDLTNYKYEEVREYLNINELRRVVNDVLYDGVAITTGQSVLGALDTTDGDLDGELNEDGDLVLSIKDGIIPNVVANPTGNATEPLTKLEVGSTIYSIPDGTIFKYIGTTTTQLTDGSTTNPITINSESITAVAGDVVFYGDDEFVFDGTTWEQFGSTGFANPMTTQGDLIVGGASGVANRLPKGTTGQVLKATASGVEWTNEIPTVAIALTQVISQDPLQVQLTNEQYNIVANNKQVIIDTSALGAEPSTVWTKVFEESGGNYTLAIPFDIHAEDPMTAKIEIDGSTKEATLYMVDILFNCNKVRAPLLDNTYQGMLVGFDANGLGTPTNSLPILTTAPSSANTNGLKIVVLSSEPATYYNGYYYIITQ